MCLFFSASIIFLGHKHGTGKDIKSLALAGGGQNYELVHLCAKSPQEKYVLTDIDLALSRKFACFKNSDVPLKQQSAGWTGRVWRRWGTPECSSDGRDEDPPTQSTYERNPFPGAACFHLRLLHWPGERTGGTTCEEFSVRFIYKYFCTLKWWQNDCKATLSCLMPQKPFDRSLTNMCHGVRGHVDLFSLSSPNHT